MMRSTNRYGALFGLLVLALGSNAALSGVLETSEFAVSQKPTSAFHAKANGQKRLRRPF